MLLHLETAAALRKQVFEVLAHS